MDTLHGPFQIPQHFGIGMNGGHLRSSDQHVIPTGTPKRRQNLGGDGPQTTFGPVAHNGVTDLLGASESNTQRPVVRGLATVACLQGERSCAGPSSPCRAQKVSALPQNLRAWAFGLRWRRCGHRVARHALRAERLATAHTAGVKDFTASFGGHTRTKTVAAFAHKVGRLVGAFHRGGLRHGATSRGTAFNSRSVL